MERYLLDKNWEFVEGNLQNPLMIGMLQGWRKTDLPHDYQIQLPRSMDAPSADNEGWTHGAALFYRKSFALEPEAAGKRFWLEFEGIAGVCELWVNGKFVAKHKNPYTGLLVEVTELLHPGENTIQLHLDSRLKPGSRWYVGTGLYRHVWLHMGEPWAIPPQGLHAETKTLEEMCKETGSLEGQCEEKKALVGQQSEAAASEGLCAGTKTVERMRAEIAVRAELSEKTERVVCRLIDREGNILAEKEADHGGSAVLEADGIVPWSPDTPTLYTLQAIAYCGEREDRSELKTGIRTVSVDAKRGFLLNGRPLKLRGGCIHHDLGLLGAAEYDDADFRRVRILKESGFNALRLAHNPFGPSIFRACDELGMLCIEEAFDEWVLGRTNFGLHLDFEDRWERDLEDMIRRDDNHPSIVMWSTGNEVEERDGSADGYAWSRRLADKVRSLDGSRPVSVTACSLFVEYGQRPAAGTTGNQALNMAYDAFAEGKDIWGPATEAFFAPADVAGYNYKTARYAYDGEKYPNRVIYGSESYPRAAFQSWLATLENNHVIGDFVWTAWEYLGEAGIGRWEISDAPRPGSVKYPWLLSYCSDFDLLGQKRPQSDYRDILWGMSKGPKLFCLPPELTGKNLARLSWGWMPVERNYTYPGYEEQRIEAHVYADGDEAELLLDGRPLERKPCSKEQEYRAVFAFPYQPGRLEAVVYRDGREIGRDSLETAGSAACLQLTGSRTDFAAGSEELDFVLIEARDSQGRRVYGETGEVRVAVENGVLLALGSADPKPDREELYSGGICPLYEGRVMAVVKPGEQAGPMRLTASLGEYTAELAWNVRPVLEPSGTVHEIRPSALDLPLGTLLENEQARNVLSKYLGPLLENPMLNQMKGMPLKKLLSMGGGIPEGLAEAMEKIIV
ncbi:MAG: DUF4982 domain-containing protein [Roseburia sp.]|nr:DUF4982 domain-containing protein [Roseburia sp.]MCM1099744.1 DUF4982 domain-containing protein [Ruminococcus flavefaciens]MCM1235542.1 DUF4982 domain-containing protein [Ruminococcus flavefaciens]